MQSSSVLGGPESRAATARLSERGQKKLQNQVRIELEYIHMCALITYTYIIYLYLDVNFEQIFAKTYLRGFDYTVYWDKTTTSVILNILTCIIHSFIHLLIYFGTLLQDLALTKFNLPAT